MNEQEKVSPLQEFNWDDEDSTFFGLNPEGQEAKIKPKEEPKEEKETPTPEDKSKTDSKDEEEDDEEVTFFDQQPKDEEVTEEDENKDKGEKVEDKSEEDDAKFYTTLAQEMIERKVFQNVEVKEGEEVDIDKFFELQDEEIQTRVDETFQSFAEEMDDDGKAFLNFKRNGGSTQDFFRVYGSKIDLSKLDVEQEKDQDAIIKHYSTLEGLDEEEISDRIEWLKENGKKKVHAEKYLAKLNDKDAKEKENLVKNQELLSAQREESIKKFNEALEKEFDKTKTVGSFNFGKVNKKDLFKYVTNPSVKVGTNKFVTPFQAALGKIFKGEGEDKQKLLLLAKLVMSDFDVKDILEQSRTEAVKAAKSNLQAAKAGVKVNSSGGTDKKSVWDYF